MWEFLIALLEKVIGFVWNRTKSDFQIEGEEYLDRNNLTYDDLLARMIGLDHVVFPGINETNEGTVKQWSPIFRKDPDSWKVLVYKKKIVAGYFCAFSVTDDAFERILSGELADSDITPAMVQNLKRPGHHNLYVCSIAAQSDFNTDRLRVRDKVFRAFAAHLLKLAKQKVYIRRICAIATTDHGIRICERYGLSRNKNECPRQGGPVYSGVFIPTSAVNSPTELTKRLLTIYQRAGL